MNEARREAYQNLIDSLLTCPSGEENQILQANSELVDVGLVQGMLERANDLRNNYYLNDANYLMTIAGSLLGTSNTIRDKSSVSAYINFLIKVLQATADSNGDRKVIYSLLCDHLKLVNDNLAVVLRNWAMGTLPKYTQKSRISRIADIVIFCLAIDEFPLGSRASNSEIAIAGYESYLKLFTRHEDSKDWGTVQNNLGLAYSKRIRGETADNLEKAISAYGRALSVFTREAFPEDWAMTQNNLGIAYRKRIRGEKAENIEKAIALYQASLEVYTRKAFPQDWAWTQNNLAVVYSNRIKGEKADNLEMAISACEAALEVRSREVCPQDWANTQNNLAGAYLNRIRGEKADNLEMAISACEAALEVYTHEAFPEGWARSQNNLAEAYLNRIRGEKADNLEMAISACEAALEVRTREAFPQDWAMTHNNLGLAYSKRIRGETADNLEMAISACEAALEVRTREEFPEDWAMIKNNLGLAYYNRIRGEKADNLEMSISAYEAALSVVKREVLPKEWAMTQNNLGLAYNNRIRGEKSDNLEMSISAYEAALSVVKREVLPKEWAMTQNNLGVAYNNRIRCEKSDNLEMAISAYGKALSVFTREAFPEDWARSQNNLGSAYRKRIRGEKADNLEKAIALYQASLEVYTRKAFPQNWAWTQNNLAVAYLDRIKGEKADNLEMAISACEESLEVYTHEAFPEGWARSQNNLGAAYLYRIREEKAENLERAIAAYEASLDVYTRDGFPIDNANTSYSLGLAYQENSQLPEAYNTFNSAIETVELMRSEIIIGGEADRQKLAEEWNKLYQSMVEVCLAMENSTAALEYVERSKTRNLVELFHKARSLPSQAQRISFAEIRSLLAENEAILEWYITYNDFKVFIITCDSPQPDIWQSSYQDLQALQELQQEYLDDIKDEEKYDNWKNQLDSRLEKLAEILHIDEIISRLPENCQKLILVPFRYLHLFPLHALASSRQKADKTVETGCLLELFPGGVRYTPSCQLLQLSQRQNLTAEDTSPSKFFAIQNPTEDLDFTDIEVEAIAKSFNPAEILSRQNASKAGLQQQIASLQNADIAHFSCHGFFDFDNPEKSALILAGAKVTPLNPPLLRGETGEDFPLVSEETEGKETPPLSKGGLGGVPSDEKRYIRSRRGENYDIAECLTLEEIFDLQLSKCRLVALSACETGLTDIKNTTDEYIGLPSGFLYAGATSVLSTLWAVNDVSTAILTIKFYELFRGETQPAVAVALRESQLWLRSVTVKGLLEWVKASQLLSREHKQKIQDRYSRGYKQDYQPYESPVYWAAFCAVGQ